MVGIAAAVWISRYRDRGATLLGASPGLTLLAGMFGVCLLHGVVARSINAFLADATAFIVLVIGV